MSGDPNYLVRVLKGREAFTEKKTPAPETKGEAERPDDSPGGVPEVEMPPEEDPPEAGPPEVIRQANKALPPDVSAEERARQQAEAEKIEAERQAEIEVRRKELEAQATASKARAAAREERRRRNAAIRAKRISKIERLLPESASFISVSSTVQTRISSLAVAAKSGKESDVRKLASAYEEAGFGLMDLSKEMNDHFEDEARAWASGDALLSWITCQRADWLAWACSSQVGWGYPGLWNAAADSVRQAVAVAASRMPTEISKFLSGVVKDLDVFIFSWRRGEPDLDLIDDLRRSTGKLVENLQAQRSPKSGIVIALKAAEATKALLTLDPDDRPPVDAIVRAAAVLAGAIPERSSMPTSWLPDDPERAEKWVKEGRPRAEIEAKLSFLAPLVRKRIPVPVSL